MNKNFKDYIKIYDLMPDSLCKQIIHELQNVNFIQHAFYDASENSYANVGDDLYTNGDILPSDTLIKPIIWNSFKFYLQETNLPWFGAWQGFTSPKWNRYPVGTNMKEHCDHIHDMFDGTRKGIPVLTVLGGLNNDYSGGDLVFFTDEVYELKAGQLMVFPSNFLFPHKVETVTEGTRYSFASWAY